MAYRYIHTTLDVSIPYIQTIMAHACLLFSHVQLSYGDKVNISRQLCQALVFMHTATPPVAHLDVKPENVFVRKEQV